MLMVLKTYRRRGHRHDHFLCPKTETGMEAGIREDPGSVIGP